MRANILRAFGCVALISQGACDGSIGKAIGPQDPFAPGSATGTGGGVGPGGGVDHGAQAPLRRLTRTQYNNTVRDLLGVDSNPAVDFGLDEEDGGFASNDRAPVEPLQVERYQLAPEALAEKAIASLTKVVPCAPPAGSEATCVEEFLRGFGKRVYRRPLTSDEITQYKLLFSVGKGTNADFASGISLVISTMLQSPHFLYRPELGDSAAASSDGWPLSPYETASRLSYFLQNTMPDDVLLAAADSNKLVTPDEMSAQARRLLAAPKGRDTVISFHQQWLEMEGILTLEKDPAVYPGFTPDLRAAMQDELREFTDYVVRQGDGRLDTLLTANFSFVRGPLFGVYGLAPPQGTSTTSPVKTTLKAGERSGLMTFESVMADHAHPNQSSPVKRGYVILDKLLCTVPPPPPANVDNTVPEPDPNVPTRIRFEQHRDNPTCATCHGLMDPLGIAFEIFDGMGRFRKMDGNQPVDASSELAGTDRDGPVKDAVELMGRLATASEVRRCLATQWFRYAFGRMETPDDSGIVAAAFDGFARSDYRIPDLLVALSTTKGFRYRLPIQP